MNPLGYLPFAPRILMKRGLPIHLTFFVTNRCQCRCKHCFYWQSLNQYPEEELSLAEIERIAGSLGPLLWLSLTGGEPFLRNDLVQVAEIFYRHNRPRHLTIVTNGQRPEQVSEWVPRIADAASQSFIHFNISVDGVGETHDEMRALSGAFDKVVETARRVHELRAAHPNIGLGVATTFNRHSQHQMEELVELMRTEIRPDHWDISLVRSPAKESEVQEVDHEAFFAWKEKLEGLLSTKEIPYFNYPLARLGLARHFVHNDYVRRYVRRPVFSVPCQAGRLSSVLYPDGAVAACELQGFGLGNIRDFDHDFGKLWQSESAREVRSRIAHSKCHCDHGCNIAVNLTFSPRTYYDIVRAFFAL